MIVGFKDAAKLIGISVIAGCAILVCTLFLNYNMDIAGAKDHITNEAGIVMYDAIVYGGKVTSVVSGGCLGLTSAIMLLFYVKNYIDTHGKELGILKALGYSNLRIAKHFWVFDISILFGCAAGFALAHPMMPFFYSAQNSNGLFPDIPIAFHPVLVVYLVLIPFLSFALLSILYAFLKLKSPVLDLLKERQNVSIKVGKAKDKDAPFLKSLKRSTVRGRKSSVFFIAFSAFCFSAMTQMSMSMNDISSETFAGMIITIGLILAFMTLLLSLTSVVKANTKTIAMMRVFGYKHSDCSKSIFGSYRPISYMGFAIGTVYQYVLLKVMVNIVFGNIENMPEYHFDFPALAISLVAFIIAYEFILYCFSLGIKKLSLKSIMLE